jgi:hypothetical protein
MTVSKLFSEIKKVMNPKIHEYLNLLGVEKSLEVIYLFLTFG